MPTLMIVEMHPIVNCRNQSRLRTKHVAGTAKPQVAASANDRPKSFDCAANYGLGRRLYEGTLRMLPVSGVYVEVQPQR